MNNNILTGKLSMTTSLNCGTYMYIHVHAITTKKLAAPPGSSFFCTYIYTYRSFLTFKMHGNINRFLTVQAIIVDPGNTNGQ